MLRQWQALEAWAAAGDLTFAKARAVYEPLQLLSDEDAARAEALIVRELPGKTYGQAEKLAAQAALTIDPDSATRRRHDAEQHRSRVQLFREESGAAGLSGRDLPTDQTLAAHASVCARASAYQQSGSFPAGTRMDQYRVTAYLDLLNGISTDMRLARAPADGEPGPDGSGPDVPGSDSSGPDGSGPGPDEAGSCARPSSSFRWRPCSAWPNGPAKPTGSAPSTPVCAATRPPSPPTAPAPCGTWSRS
ncbi:MAG TPA: hypothetical protein VHF26_12185, partial [Trebonia sp.]|nr:hypothetical protein [Trebonia sp.]